MPLDRGKIYRKLLFVQKNMQKSLHLGIVEQSLDRSIFFQQQALAGVKGKTKSRQIILILSWGNDKNECLVFVCRRGLLAYVYSGVFV